MMYASNPRHLIDPMPRIIYCMFLMFMIKYSFLLWNSNKLGMLGLASIKVTLELRGMANSRDWSVSRLISLTVLEGKTMTRCVGVSLKELRG